MAAQNTREMANQLNKYRHGALSLQHHAEFPEMCVYLVCLFVKITIQTSKSGCKD
jgi:hypothetical protein